MYSAHFFRQAQTAQTADLFLNGYTDFLNPAVYFTGKPGYLLLELPVYQYLVALFSKFTHLKLEHSALILNSLSLILLLVCLSSLLTEWIGKKTGKNAFYLPLLLSPLLFGMSFWFSIEVFNLALTAASLALFAKFVKSEKIDWSALSWFSLVSALSLAIKPNHIYSVVPLYIFFIYKTVSKIKLKKILIFFASMAPVLALFIFWTKHSNEMSKLYYNPFSINGHYAWYLWGNEPITVNALAKFASRFFLYTINPLVLILFFLKRDKFINPLPLFGSMILYVCTFSNLNLHHSYYQLPMLIPIFLLFAPHLQKLQSGKSGKIAILTIALATFLIGYVRLIKEDRDWVAASNAIVEQFHGDLNSPELRIFTNTEAGAVALAYDLHRFVKYSDFEKPLTSADKKLLVCDLEINADCKTTALQKTEVSNITWRDFGHVTAAIIQ